MGNWFFSRDESTFYPTKFVVISKRDGSFYNPVDTYKNVSIKIVDGLPSFYSNYQRITTGSFENIVNTCLGEFYCQNDFKLVWFQLPLKAAAKLEQMANIVNDCNEQLCIETREFEFCDGILTRKQYDLNPAYDEPLNNNSYNYKNPTISLRRESDIELAEFINKSKGGRRKRTMRRYYRRQKPYRTYHFSKRNMIRTAMI